MRYCQFFLLFVLTMASLWVRADSAPETAAALLKQMSTALREQNYSGLFTYEHGGILQTLKVSHWVIDGQEHEQLEHLNGPARSVSRGGNALNCLSPADQLLRGLLPAADGSFNGLSQHYHFYVRGEQRIAGRMGRVLQIMPRDEYRHGYTLALDRETGLPLLAMMVTVNRRVLERLQFVSLELGVIGPEVDLAAADPNLGQRCLEDASVSPWHVGWMPSGFMLASAGKAGELGDSLAYTDGLSSFSVFVMPMNEAVAVKGSVQRGATVAYMQQHQFGSVPYTVTVVGEIPVKTAQRIADSVGIKEPALIK
jgi:sigma-E factor negative regulatory protein RseB